jgi:hypothetical protein
VKRRDLRRVVAGGTGGHVAHLEHRDVEALPLQEQGRREADDAGADHDRVDRDVALERRPLGCRPVLEPE